MMSQRSLFEDMDSLMTDSDQQCFNSLWSNEQSEKSWTPPSKGGNSTESTQGGSVEFSMPSRKPLGRFHSFDVQRRLFACKRAAEDSCSADISPVSKKLREAELQLEGFSFSEPEKPSVIEAVDRLITREDLIGDGSRDSSLPTISGKELKSISCQTMADLLEGQYSDKVTRFSVIDCRYPYEFNAGHIKGAVNMHNRQSIQQFLWQHASSAGNHVLIFHCEFSSERGPKMYRLLRTLDRELNKEHYPRLHFPEIYLLQGGYKAFFQFHKDLCYPCAYKPMLHEDHAAELRHFRVKSRSWAAGEKLPLRKTKQSCSTVLF